MKKQRMDDVTVQSEAAKPDSEVLPEPLLIILSPPPPFLPASGQPAMVWHKWLRSFELYVEALGESELVDASKCVLLQNCLGQEGQDVLAALIRSGGSGGGTRSYAEVVSVLTGFFTADRTAQISRLEFHHRARMPGETVGEFVSALEELLWRCGYDDSHERRIVEKLIGNAQHPQLRDRLLSEKDSLTLAQALLISKQAESESLPDPTSGFHEVSVDIGDDADPPAPVKRKRGRPRRGEEKAKPQPVKTSGFKDDFYYSKDELYHSDDLKRKTRSSVLASRSRGASSSPQKIKEDVVSEDDKDSTPPPSKLKGPYCPICVDKRFRDANKLARHMRAHTKEKPFRCPVCAQTFSQTYHVTRHLRNQHGAKQRHICSACGKSFQSPEEMKVHRRAHVLTHTCPDCSEKFANDEALRLHMESHGGDGRESEGRSSDEGTNRVESNNKIPQIDDRVRVDMRDDAEPPAPVKRKRGRPRRGEEKPKPQPVKTQTSRFKDNFYYSKDELYHSDEHEGKTRRAAAANRGRGKVTNEGEASSSSPRIKEDVVSEDGEDSVSSKLKGPYCPICVDKRFRDANKLARHMRAHTKEKPFRCPVCAQTFSQTYHVTRHLKNQHGAQRRHICSACGESFQSPEEMKVHRRAHVLTHTCPDCSEKFANDEALRLHMVESHGGESEGRSSDEGTNRVESNNEICESGGDESDSVDSGDTADEADVKVEEEPRAISQDGKKDNVAPRTNGKVHVCTICTNRCFKGANKLARHMRTHTKEKPFACPVCALTFSQSYHMTRHVRNQHGCGNYICSQCGRSWASWMELKNHKKTHGGGGGGDELKCFACDKQFKQKSALASHLKVHNKVRANPGSLACDDCGKVFRRLYHLKRHLMTHRKDGSRDSLACPDCERHFLFAEDLNKHLRVHVKENGGACPKCAAAFGSAEELEAHMEVHDKTYACGVCQKKFKVEYALKKHEQVHKCQSYFCALCRKRFLKLSHYKKHTQVHERREAKCPHCDSVFLQLTALKYHLRTHTRERPHQCACCVETFEEAQALERHRLKHKKFKKERPYSCTRCDLAFSALLELTEHMNAHEGEQPSSCPICGRTFLNKNKLEKHLSIHTGERPHLCAVCGNGYPSAASLRLHVIVHTGEKPFRCQQCAKGFRSASGLRLHGRQHMAVRPSYQCPECGRSYGRMTELKMHQRYHTGDKPYSCTCCSKRFINKHKLSVHMRIHTGERPYSCPHCGQTFTQTGDRNRHISKYH